jgi:hypothetical protein
MTKAELIYVLKNTSGDIEIDHSIADEALLEYINDPEITEAFNAVERWYA